LRCRVTSIDELNVIGGEELHYEEDLQGMKTTKAIQRAWRE
jgi:hypothetical protein